MLEFDKKYTIVLKNVDKTLGKVKRIDRLRKYITSQAKPR